LNILTDLSYSIAEQDHLVSFSNGWFGLGIISSGSTDAIVLR